MRILCLLGRLLFQTIRSFLPAGGTAAPLTQDVLDPNGGLNVFAGQMTAISLSLGFDAYDPNFGPSDTPLADLVVLDMYSPFFGQTVGQVVAEGRKALSGCPTAYTISQLNDVISGFNETFVDGDPNNYTGFIGCPTGL